MISLDEINSRMKDFYDLYMILKTCRIDQTILLEAIRNTFTTRKTVLPANPMVFSDQFFSNPTKMRMWTNFLDRTDITGTLSFQEVFMTIRKYMKPIYSELQVNTV